MAATNFTPISLYYTTTAAAAPSAGNLVNGELAINITDGKLYYKDNAGVVRLLASNSGASGDVVGPASATDNAIARFDGTTGKLIQNSAVTIGDTGNTVIEVTDNSNAALRITQLGTGNALLVEDSTNPDSSPFVIDASGVLVSGYTAPVLNTGSAVPPRIQTHGSGSNSASISLTSWLTGTGTGPSLFLSRSEGGVAGTQVIVDSGDQIGAIRFTASDGTNFIEGARIEAAVDGTPGTNDMPGRLVFSTTADGASSPTEKMRIDSAGNVGIGAVSVAGNSLRVGKNITGSVNGIGIFSFGTTQSDVTTQSRGFATFLATQATAFTLPTLSHYQANQNTIGAGSTVTNQYGFQAAASLVGATNNYGFYSEINSGTGRWNFYANGTAENFFGGNTVISVTDNSNAALRITQLGTGNALLVEDSTNPDSSPFVIDAGGRVVVGYTTTTDVLDPNGNSRTPQVQIQGLTQSGAAQCINNWAASGTSYPVLYLSKSKSGTIGTRTAVASGDTIGDIQFSGDDGTNFVPAARIFSQVDGTPGTNDMPGRLVFSTTADGSATPTERFRIDSTGNALFAKAVRATITTDNDLSFDMNAASNFKCTPTSGGALTFTNITSGQTGNIILVNGSNYAITAAATTKVSATCLATISATGTYWLSYYSDGTNVYVANTGALA